MTRLGLGPFDEKRFAAHERFFVGDVRNWVQSRFGVALPRKHRGGHMIETGTSSYRLTHARKAKIKT